MSFPIEMNGPIKNGPIENGPIGKQSQDPETIVVTGVYTPEIAEVIATTAGEFAVLAAVYDFKEPESQDAFSTAVAQAEKIFHSRNDGVRPPRTASEIKKDMVDYAIRMGMVGVVLTPQSSDSSLGDFWKKVNEKAPPKKA